MDSHYHNLPLERPEARTTAIGQDGDTNAAQRTAYHQDLRDDVSSISEERNEDSIRNRSMQPDMDGLSEKGPQLAVGSVAPDEFNDTAHEEGRRKHEHPARFIRLKNITHDWWLWEIAALAISFAAMLALVVVLRVHEGKPLPHWPVHITINAFISVTSTIMKAAIAVPLTACISQMKWIWFKTRRHVFPDSLQTFVIPFSVSRQNYNTCLTIEVLMLNP